MLFSSLEFLYLFLPISIFLYFLTPSKLKNTFLLIVSVIFYALGEARFLPLLILVASINYVFAIIIGVPRESQRGKRRAIFVVAVALNVGILGFFKYFDFLLDALRFPSLGILLPLGISFYVFQSLSYTADVYLGKVEPQRNAIKFFTYVTLFPQLVAGPIVKYSDIREELDSRKHTVLGAADGVRLFCVGLSKKVLLANPSGEVWDRMISRPDIYSSTLSAWLGIVFFAFQIYFDFSGYSDMARGLGKIFGFSFPENFKYPYISQSLTEFWRRWHITLSTWFREYVYIPLGGNRKGKFRTYLNLLCVWLLTGLWHGAGINFILWGLFFFVMISLEKAFLGRLLIKLPRVFRHIYALLFILCGWLIFAFDSSMETLSAAEGVRFFFRLFGYGAVSPHGEEIYLLVRHLPYLAILAIASTPLVSGVVRYILGERKIGRRSKKIATQAVLNIVSLLSILLCTAYIADSGYNPFLYFRF